MKKPLYSITTFYNAIGLVFSSIGNGLFTLIVARTFAQNETADYARVFLLYTLVITFIRPLFVDPLANLAHFKNFNFYNFRKQSVGVAVVSSLLLTLILVIDAKQLRSQEIALAILLPALVLHDIGRFFQIAIGKPINTAKADAFWAITSTFLLLLSFLWDMRNMVLLLIIWAGPTLVTSCYLFRKTESQKVNNSSGNWLKDTLDISVPNFGDFLLSNGLFQAIYFISVSAISNQEAINFRISVLLISPIILIQSILVLNFFSSTLLEEVPQSKKLSLNLVRLSIILTPFLVYELIAKNIEFFKSMFGNSINIDILEILKMICAITSSNLFQFIVVRDLRKKKFYSKILKIRILSLFLTIITIWYRGFHFQLIEVLQYLLLYSLLFSLFVVIAKLGKK